MDIKGSVNPFVFLVCLFIWNLPVELLIQLLKVPINDTVHSEERHLHLSEKDSRFERTQFPLLSLSLPQSQHYLECLKFFCRERGVSYFPCISIFSKFNSEKYICQIYHLREPPSF